jgi:hypothetical protein
VLAVLALSRIPTTLTLSSLVARFVQGEIVLLQASAKEVVSKAGAYVVQTFEEAFAIGAIAPASEGADSRANGQGGAFAKEVPSEDDSSNPLAHGHYLAEDDDLTQTVDVFVHNTFESKQNFSSSAGQASTIESSIASAIQAFGDTKGPTRATSDGFSLDVQSQVQVSGDDEGAPRANFGVTSGVEVSTDIERGDSKIAIVTDVSRQARGDNEEATPVALDVVRAESAVEVDFSPNFSVRDTLADLTNGLGVAFVNEIYDTHDLPAHYPDILLQDEACNRERETAAQSGQDGRVAGAPAPLPDRLQRGAGHAAALQVVVAPQIEGVADRPVHGGGGGGADALSRDPDLLLRNGEDLELNTPAPAPAQAPDGPNHRPVHGPDLLQEGAAGGVAQRVDENASNSTESDEEGADGFESDTTEDDKDVTDVVGAASRHVPPQQVSDSEALADARAAIQQVSDVGARAPTEVRFIVAPTA